MTKGSCAVQAATSDCDAASDPANTLLTKLHELRKTTQKASHTITESIKKKVENQLAAPTSPCLSTATDSGVNSRESTHSLTPREGSLEECSPVFEAAQKSWLTDKEISAAEGEAKERQLQPWSGPVADDGALEELRTTEGDWDQFKANAELFGYVSTFKEDLSQYSTTIDMAKVPVRARKKAERLAREIEVRQSVRGSADEEAVEGDEETLFSAVQTCDYARSEAPKKHGKGTCNFKDGEATAESQAEKHAKQTKVAGSFFHVDGVGLLEENLVRSNPWMLDSSPSMAPQAPALLSTQPQGPAPECTVSPVLSTAPVAPVCTHAQPSHFTRLQMPQPLAAGTGVVIDGLLTSPAFNGLHGIIESYDIETNRYNVQLPMLDIVGAAQVAKIRAENLKLYPSQQC
mmetsp:Transcript_21151/g.39757  ORF Transcript_21151/g.39757 Transcript_21151/m.39757 type:complete len:404 (+) Transcript_21151:66-1277(+)